MFQSIHDIDLHRLKKNHMRLYYFGLGFIQLKIDETYRLHFYTKELEAIAESPHNHRYNFLSRVLSGDIENTLYEVQPGTGWTVTRESCSPHVRPPVGGTHSCALEQKSSKVIKAGDSYFMPHQIFHRVKAEECITLLMRGDYQKEFAEVATPEGQNVVCPFSKVIEESKLWKIIENMIEDAKK